MFSGQNHRYKLIVYCLRAWDILLCSESQSLFLCLEVWIISRFDVPKGAKEKLVTELICLYPDHTRELYAGPLAGHDATRTHSSYVNLGPIMTDLAKQTVWHSHSSCLETCIRGTARPIVLPA